MDVGARQSHAAMISGQVANPNAWLVLLKRADGIIFVADSQRERLDANVEALVTFNSLSAGLGRPVSTPLVFQYNKRDLPNSATREELSVAL